MTNPYYFLLHVQDHLRSRCPMGNRPYTEPSDPELAAVCEAIRIVEVAKHSIFYGRKFSL